MSDVIDLAGLTGKTERSDRIDNKYVNNVKCEYTFNQNIAIDQSRCATNL